MTAAATVTALAKSVVDAAIVRHRGLDDVDAHQVMLYDIAHAASAVEMCRSVIDDGEKGTDEGNLACAFIADVVADLAAKILGREHLWGVEPGALDGAREFLGTYRDPEFLASLAKLNPPSHLDEDFELVAETFRRFAEDKIAPVAEHIHRRHGALGVELADGGDGVGDLLAGDIALGHLADDGLGYEWHTVSDHLVEQVHQTLLGSGA